MTPYKQAFVITMETGVIALVVVMGEDEQHGEGLAHSEAQDVLDGQVWDVCAYPTTAGLPVGVTVWLPDLLGEG